MGKQKTDVCPGCSRHCPLSHVRCKYGKKYIEKHRRDQQAAGHLSVKGEEKKPRRKWEKHVMQGSTVWKLLFTASRLKKALRKEHITEAQLLAALTPQDRAMLDALLERISSSIP